MIKARNDWMMPEYEEKGYEKNENYLYNRSCM